MATSTTDICNMALSYLGANPIIEIHDKTPEANLCKLNFNSCRDAVLEDIDWTFATRRYLFEAYLRIKPVFGYHYAYELPNEVLRVIEVNENKIDWALEERKILCDATACYVKAIVRIEDPDQWSPNFIKALASYLASEIALPLTNSPAVQQQMAAMYMAKRQFAQGNDGRQGRNVRRYSSEWIR